MAVGTLTDGMSVGSAEPLARRSVSLTLLD